MSKTIRNKVVVSTIIYALINDEGKKIIEHEKPGSWSKKEATDFLKEAFKDDANVKFTLISVERESVEYEADLNDFLSIATVVVKDGESDVDVHEI